MPCPYCAAPTTTEMCRRTTLGDRMFHCRACRRTCNERTGCAGWLAHPCVKAMDRSVDKTPGHRVLDCCVL